MRKQDQEKIFATLDKIEELTSVPDRNGGAIEIGLPGIDGEAFDLMVKIARERGGVKLLVEKYAASLSQIIVGALLLVLTDRAKRRRLKNAHLLFDFIGKLQLKDRWGILVTTLTAIKFQIGLAKVWHRDPMPDSCYPFVQYCLHFTNAQADSKSSSLSDEVQLNVIDVLWTMCKERIYNLNFDEAQRRWLEDKVREIQGANSGNEMLQKDVLYFFDCIDKQNENNKDNIK